MNWKETYTKIFLTQLGKVADESNMKHYMPIWWQNVRSKASGGLRLTDEGFNLLTELDISTYEIPYPKDMPLTTQALIFLDQFIDCPYYITKKSITVTNEKKAVELTLFSGDVRRYGFIKAISKMEKDKDIG
jgi:NAD-dependent DNA ligase